MKRARSPIEMMVDKACGFDPDAPTKPPLEEETKALCAVGDAAVTWFKKMSPSLCRTKEEENLFQAASKLFKLGWK
jgi:hypothetical protein